MNTLNEAAAAAAFDRYESRRGRGGMSFDPWNTNFTF